MGTENELLSKMESLVKDTLEKAESAATVAATEAVDSSEKIKAVEASITEMKSGHDLLQEDWKKFRADAEKAKADETSWAHPDLDDPDKLKNLKWCDILRGISEELRPGTQGREAWAQSDHMKWTHKILNETKEIVKASGYTGKAGLQESIDEQGGYFVPMQLANKFIELLIAKLVLTNLGASTMENLTGTPVNIPEEISGMAFQFVGENGIPAESAPRYGTIKLEPKRLSGFITVSNRLLRMASISVEQRVRNRMVRDAALAAEAGILFGNGGIAPRGLVNIPGITTLQLNAGTGRRAIADDLELQRVLIRTANVPGDIAWLTREEVVSFLKTQKVQHFAGQTANLGYVHTPPILSKAALDARIGGKIETTTALGVNAGAPLGANTTSLIAGVWEYLQVGFWARMAIRASREASLGNRSAFLQNETWWVLDMEMDSNVTRKSAFHIIQDALTV